MKQILSILLVLYLFLSPAKAMSYYNSCGDTGCGEFFIEADYLYWTACRSDLDYFWETTTLILPGFTGSGTIFNVEPSWNSGFRLNAGYQSAQNWNCNARYTYYRTHSSSHVADTIGGATRPAFQTAIIAPVVTDATANYRLRYDVVDLEAGYWQDLLCNLSIRPFLGVRFGWMEQRLQANYVRGQLDPNLFISTQNSDMHSYGSYVGSDASVPLFGCFSVIVRGSFGAHYGKFTNDTLLATPDESIILTLSNGKDCHAVYTTEIAAGLEYGRSICGWEWDVAVGYELQTWLNLQDFQNFSIGTTTLRNNASLLLHGLFARVGVGF